MPTLNGIFYAERGSGPPLVCLHGAGGRHTHWGHLLAGLSDVAHVLAPDLPGHGRSSLPAPTTLAAYAARVLALLDALELEQALLVGHSMGAAVALEAYLAAPARITGMVLLGAAARLRVTPAILTGLNDDPSAAVTALVNAMYPASADLRPAAIQEYLRDPAILRHDLQLCDGWDGRANLRPGPPALVISGAADQLTPPKLATELRDLLAARLVSLPDVGHVPMLEAPQASVEAIRIWLG